MEIYIFLIKFEFAYNSTEKVSFKNLSVVNKPLNVFKFVNKNGPICSWCTLKYVEFPSASILFDTSF